MKKYSIVFLLVLSLSVNAQIKFDANFESGNLHSVTTRDSVSYNVTSKEDIGGRWFYFRMSGVKNRLVKVTITNSDVHRPFYSYDNENFCRFSALESSRENYFEKTFQQDTVYVSYYIPYNYSYLQKNLTQWSRHKDVTVDTIGYTGHSLPLQLMTITDRSVDNANKKSVWIHARTHPSETPSSWHLEGIIKELLGDSELAEFYKKNMIFYIVPFSNPDGVYYGRSRTNYEYIDIESNWDKSESETTREVKILKQKMLELCGGKVFSVLLNMHSQASPYCTFWLHTASSTSDEFFRKQNQFANLNVSGCPYFVRDDFSQSNLRTVYPEGFIHKSYGENVMALTYETPYDQYSTGIWVTNENLYELGTLTVHAIAEYMGLSSPRKVLLDNSGSIVSGDVKKDSSGLEFYGNDYLLLNNGVTNSITYRTGELESGLYNIDAWYPSDASYSEKANYTVEYGDKSKTAELNQKINGGKWNKLSQIEMQAGGTISIKLDNTELAPVVADAFRITYMGNATGLAKSDVPAKFALLQNYPNPFNPETTVKYILDKASNVKLVVYDVTGREICSLEDGFKTAGVHEARFNASGYSSGIYICHLFAEHISVARKMIYLK